MLESDYALGHEGAKHAVRAIGSTTELILAASRALDPGRPPGLALIDLARAQEANGRVAAELAMAAEKAKEVLAARDEAALEASTAEPGGGAEAEAA